MRIYCKPFYPVVINHATSTYFGGGGPWHHEDPFFFSVPISSKAPPILSLTLSLHNSPHLEPMFEEPVLKLLFEVGSSSSFSTTRMNIALIMS